MNLQVLHSPDEEEGVSLGAEMLCCVGTGSLQVRTELVSVCGCRCDVQ